MDIRSSMPPTGSPDNLRDLIKPADGATRSTAIPLSEALPAAIYHPGTNTPEDLSSFDVYMQTGRPVRANGAAPRTENAILEDIGGAERDLQSALNNFLQELSGTDPTLARQKFGFSVDKDGKLLVLDSQNALNQQQRDRLTTALNRSRAMVDTSNRLARLHIERVESGNVNDYGRFQLDLSNYAQTIDLGLAIGHRASGGEIFDGIWFNQLWAKGEVRYGGWIKIMGSGR